MKQSSLRLIVNCLIAGCVVGFLGGAWASQSSHANKVGSDGTDLTTRAILSQLANVRRDIVSLRSGDGVDVSRSSRPKTSGSLRKL